MEKTPKFNNKTRNEILSAITEANRKHSTRIVLFHQAIANRLGIGPTDHKCLDIIFYEIKESGEITAGQVAKVTGLTTGAVTAVLDRLEKANFIKREFDKRDRRKVFIKIIPDRIPEVINLHETALKAFPGILAGYSDEELLIILDYITKATEMLKEAAIQLSKTQKKSKSGK